MEHARIAIFEDSPEIQQLLISNLTQAGHDVDLVVSQLEDVPLSILEFTPARFDVAIVDANLDHGRRGGEDGATVAALLNLADPELITIGFCSQPEHVRGAHLQLYKPNIGDLVKIIDALQPRQAFR